MLARLAFATFIGAFSLLANAAPSFAQELVRCAPEGGYCRTPYPTTVIYGARGQTTAQEVGRGIPCNNGSFGDPAPGVVKHCSYVARRGGIGPGPGSGPSLGGGYDGGYNWRPCAGENGYCSFRGTKRVRYGAAGRFTERTSHNGVACSNRVFGDPAPGNVKSCYVRD